MATLKRAILGERVEMHGHGVKEVHEKIMDRNEIVSAAIPTVFPAQLALQFSAPPGETFEIATETRDYMKNVVSYDSGGKVISPDSGDGETAIPMPIPVHDVGPSYVALFFDGAKVWEQTVFFALARS